MAILAIFGGYFGYFLPNSLFLNSMTYHFRKPMVWVEKWPNQIFWQIDLGGKFVKKNCGQYISELQAILTARWFSRTDSLVRKSIPHTCKIGKLLFGPHNHIQSGARSRSYIDGFLMWNTSWKIGENSEFVVVHISQWISEFQNVSKPPKTT